MQGQPSGTTSTAETKGAFTTIRKSRVTARFAKRNGLLEATAHSFNLTYSSLISPHKMGLLYHHSAGVRVRHMHAM